MPPKPTFSYEIEQEIARRHLAGEQIYLLAREYNVWPSRIRAAIERHGGQFVSFDYKFNEHAFDALDNEQVCYWLGFIFADGYVAEEGVRINIKRSDEQHLHKFKAFLQADQPIVQSFTSTKGVQHPRSSIMISNRKLAQQLSDLGIQVDRPDPLRAISKIPNDLLCHWFRGMFDGDGCAHETRRLTFLSQEPILIVLKHELMKRSLIAQRPSFPNGPSIHGVSENRIFRLSISGFTQCRRVADYLYQDATVWMERKRDIIDGWQSRTLKRVELRCLYCNEVFSLPPNEMRRRQFCSLSCSTSHNNKARANPGS